MTLERIPRIRIEVPSGAAAPLPANRMKSLHRESNALWDGTRWRVEVTGDDAGIDDVVTVAREWLGQMPPGAGYDGPALEHEPSRRE